MPRKHLIIGCGPAALRALEEIRNISSDDEIKLVTMEHHLPYSPSALPFLLSGRIKENDIWLRDESYFHRINAAFARGKEVVKVLPDKKEVIYSDEDCDTYDNLLIASGSKPIKPLIKGSKEAGYSDFHVINDYQSLLKQLDKKNIVVCGAGLVGIEVSMALLERGYSVNVIELENRILPRYFDREVAAVIEDILRSQGAQIYTNSKVCEIRADKGKTELILENGSSLNSDVLIMALGVEPRINFIERSGIDINRGIVVDSSMRTNIPDIYAAGDVAETHSFIGNEIGVNPILPNALTQGEVAGANMAGKETNFQGWIAMNILDFFGNSALSVGLSMQSQNGYQVMEDKKDKGAQFTRFVYEGDRLVGAMLINIDVHPGTIRYLIEKKVDIGTNKSAFLEKPDEISRWLVLENERKLSKSIYH